MTKQYPITYWYGIRPEFLSKERLEEAKEAGALCVTLGPRILRTETAAIASVTVAMTLWGDI